MDSDAVLNCIILVNIGWLTVSVIVEVEVEVEGVIIVVSPMEFPSLLVSCRIELIDIRTPPLLFLIINYSRAII